MSQQINLFNPALARPRQIISLAGLVALAAVTALGLATWVRFTGERATSAEAAASAAAAEVNAEQERLTQLAKAVAARKPSGALESEVRQAEVLTSGREEILRVLKGGAIGNTAGFSEYLRAFARQSFDGMWLTGLAIGAGGAEMTLSGRSLDASLVPAYLQRLNRESVMSGRTFASLSIQEPPAPAPAPSQPRPAAIATADAAATGTQAKPPPEAPVPPPRFVEFQLSTAEPDGKAAPSLTGRSR